MAEGVQIYRKESLVTCGETRLDNVKIHAVVMLLGFLCVTIGVSLRISANSDHFTSTHGKLGLSAWIIAFVAAIGGLVSSRRKNSIIKLIHVAVGVTAYLLGIIALVFGLSYLKVGDYRQMFLILLLFNYVGYSLLGPFKSVLNFIRN
ncbi:hypothetical protein JTB14_012379 [Gonioctena quinquepunctata]|nr:hypothetical protein JTB14_012379 [Gonioctena quinquepunctata]